MFMFCGPYFLHIYAGHLPHNAVIVWIPLILLAIDGIVEDSRRLRWALLGCAALSMQILAGHPQYVYYTGIAATLYLAISLIAQRDRDDKGRIYAGSVIPIYWIVNLVDHQVEVYTAPSGPTPAPAYAQRQDFRAGMGVPLVLDGVAVATIPAADLLP